MKPEEVPEPSAAEAAPHLHGPRAPALLSGVVPKKVDKAEYERLAPIALHMLERILVGEEMGATVGQKLTAAQWVLEKHSGKPKQEIETSGSGMGVAAVVAAVAALKEAMQNGAVLGPPKDEQGNVIDVIAQERDEVDSWVDQNVPVLGSEKK